MEAADRFWQQQLPGLWYFFPFEKKPICFDTFTSAKVKKRCDILTFRHFKNHPSSDMFSSVKLKLLSQKILFSCMSFKRRKVCAWVWAQVRTCECVCVIFLVRDILFKATPSTVISNTIQGINQEIQIERKHLWIAATADLFVGLQITLVFLREWNTSSFTISYYCYMPEGIEQCVSISITQATLLDMDWADLTL